MKKRKPPSEATKRKISETLSGQKFGGSHQNVVDPRGAKELRKRISQGDDFKYQALIDWYRDISGS